MRLDSVHGQQNNQKSKTMKAARNGALVTGTLFAASASLSWIAKPDEMVKYVKASGGTSSYIKKYVFGLGMLSAVGALMNVVAHFVEDKLAEKKPPKAAN